MQNDEYNRMFTKFNDCSPSLVFDFDDYYDISSLLAFISSLFLYVIVLQTQSNIQRLLQIREKMKNVDIR
jgi:hypothetical protein